MKVYQAISAASAQIAADGIGKDRRSQQGYNFRGIDDVYQAFAPVLAKHKLVVLPRLTEHKVDTVPTKNGQVQRVIVHADFDFVSAEDGSKHTVSTYGEGSDSLDKATNKAMSAAYKYAMFMSFCIPVEGVFIDSEDEVPVEAPAKTAEQRKQDRKTETEEDKAARQSEHHESWKRDQPRFMAKLTTKAADGGLEIQYDELCEMLEMRAKAAKRPLVRPSQMTQNQRDKLLDWIGSAEGGEAFAEYLAAKEQIETVKARLDEKGVT